MAAKPVRIAILANASQAKRELDSTARAASGFGKRVRTVAKVGAAGVTAVVGSALVKGFKRLNSIDTARTKMEALGKSGREVDRLMDSALKSVRGTSYGLDEAATVAASASAAGVKSGRDMTRYLTTVANAASLTGRSMGDMGAIINKVQTNGIASMAELNQINDAGIGITQELAKHYGVTAVEMRKMVSAGKVDADTFNTVLAGMTDGAAKTMGTTLDGIRANIGASLGRIGAAFLGGVFPAIKTGASGLLDVMGGIEARAGEWAERLNAAVSAAVGYVSGLDFTAAKEAAASLAESAGKAFDGVRAAGEPLAGVVRNLIDLFGPLAAALAKVAAAAVFTVIKGALEAVAVAAEPAASALEAVTGWLADHKGTIKTVGMILAGVLSPALIGITGTLVAQGAALATTKAAWLAYGVVSKAMAVTTQVMTAAQWAFNAAQLASPTTWIILALVALVAAIVLVVKNIDKVRAVWAKVWTAVKAATAAAWTAVTAAVRGGVASVVGFIKGLPGKARAALSSLAGFLAAATVAGFNAMRAKAAEGAARVLGYMKSIPGRIRGVFSGASTMLRGIGGQIVQGLANGIDAARQWVIAKVRALADLVPKWLRKKLGIFSPSRVTTALGKFVTSGLAKGIVKAMPEARAAVKKLADLIADPKATEAKIKAGTRRVVAALRAAARDRVKELRKNAREYAANVAAGARDFAGLAGMQLDEGETLTAAGIGKHLRDRLAALKHYTANLKRLAKAGISKALYSQIVDMGPEQGAAYAEALAKATPAQIKALNKTQGEIAKAAKSLGGSTAETMHQAGIDAAEGFWRGIKKRTKKLAEAGLAMSKALVRALQKALGIDTKKAGKAGGKAKRPELAKSEGVKSGKAGQVITVNVKVAPGANPVEAGREVARVLRPYLAAGGTL